MKPKKVTIADLRAGLRVISESADELGLGSRKRSRKHPRTFIEGSVNKGRK